MWAMVLDGLHDGMPESVAEKPAAVRLSGRRAAMAVGTPRREPTAAAAGEDPLRACVAGMQKGDQAALARLYDATAGRLYGVVNRIVRQPELAEEVLADVYHQAWRDCARYDPARGQVMAWLLIMCRTRSLDALRRKDEAISHPDPATLGEPLLATDAPREPEDILQAFQAQSELALALQELSALQRQLIALAFYKGLSHAEIAEHCGMPLGSVKTHLRRALQTLKQAMPSLSQHL